MAKSNGNGAATAAPKESDTTLPLFFQTPVPLDLKKHGSAGLAPSDKVNFASATNSILVNAVEFIEAAKQYPIVFTQTDLPMPSVVLGLEQQNYFVTADGTWQKGAYVPAYVRKYPFIFMDVPEAKQFVLCIDESAPQFRKNGGKDTLAFYDGEKPSELTRNALEFCTAFHNYFQFTKTFCEALKAADLLTSTRSTAKIASSGREINLGGFLVIDEKKFNELPDEKIAEFRKKGWLHLIYFALMSSSNWNKLVEMAAEREVSKAA